MGRPVPNAVLKVPTGGGKTYLAVHGVSRILGRYLARDVGFVLWIVPNDAIYRQTLRNLKDRAHPYRQALDRAAAGRVRILEKTDPLDARDVEASLCVMLLMLQSANRQTKDTLRLFRDRGDVQGFVPPEGEQAAHKALIDAVPNLDAYDDIFPMVKDSLGNALRIIRPIVVMDEGHRAVSELAYATLYGFNPCFVLELTATPQDVAARGGADPRPARPANILVEVTGRDLDREGMIKMPLNLDSRQRHGLEGDAGRRGDAAGRAGGPRRRPARRAGPLPSVPIMLVQVERTGADQRDGGHIHAEDVRERLQATGFDAAEIAVKTAETDDLKQLENLDLLSRTNRVRVIITKQALQEGWDCPFAYVLCALAASSNRKAMTQLVGRILRQPQAEKTGMDPLDEAYVVTHRAETKNVLDAIKAGLEEDGLGDLVLKVESDGGDGAPAAAKIVRRRPEFASLRIDLPKVLWVEDGTARELDYEDDILSRVDWSGYDPAPIAEGLQPNAPAAESQMHRIVLAEDGAALVADTIVSRGHESLRFDPAHAVRVVSDIVPNPFVARDIVGRLVQRLTCRLSDEAVGKLSGTITDELRRGLNEARLRMAECVFRDAVADGCIQFRLRVDGENWRMPDETTVNVSDSRQLQRDDGSPLERSLFAPVYEAELNGDEQAVAVYLDGQEALAWWHRNLARNHYGLPGWRPGKVYPDFVFAARRAEGGNRIVMLETKGDQLGGNLDTEYKRALLDVLSESFAWDQTVPAETLNIVQVSGETVECALVLMSEWKAKLPALMG